ncbi:MAG: hypothetical protein KKD56_07480 [Acidobacteria bacterium]|nr:hypothetical protein [Acidobacteriota bacterium]
MKKPSVRFFLFFSFLFSFLLFCFFVLGDAYLLKQDIQHEAVAVNIEVPVRVYSKGEVIDNLRIEDFELYDDGKLQKIDALYFLKHSEITRMESREELPDNLPVIQPDTQRHFVLIFQMMKYLPEVGEALDYFFSDVLQKDDTLVVMSPIKTYQFRKEDFQKAPLVGFADQLKAKLKKDILDYSFEYGALLRQLIQAMSNSSGEDGSVSWNMIRMLLERMRDHIYLDPTRVKNFASYLNDLEGQKHVILLFQNELMPFPKSDDPELELKKFELVQESSMNLEEIRNYYAESSIHFHFSYITRRENQMLDITRQLSFESMQLEFIEFKQDIFSVFKDIADTTGGITDSSYNARISFQKAVEAVENYYLLYYTPNNYRADGKYHTIKLKIKEGGYRIVHRQGYIAD